MDTQDMIQKIAEYFKTQPVLKAWLFGSYSRGEERPDSDVDILVDLDYNQSIDYASSGFDFACLRTRRRMPRGGRSLRMERSTGLPVC